MTAHIIKIDKNNISINKKKAKKIWICHSCQSETETYILERFNKCNNCKTVYEDMNNRSRLGFVLDDLIGIRGIERENLARESLGLRLIPTGKKDNLNKKSDKSSILDF
jgi:acetyl-CoA carboxylase beta subunit